MCAHHALTHNYSQTFSHSKYITNSQIHKFTLGNPHGYWVFEFADEFAGFEHSKFTS